MTRVHWTGQPFIDAGLAALAEVAKVTRLEDLDEDHLRLACRDLEHLMTSDQALGINLDRSFAKSSLSQVFPNSELVNPSNWKGGPEAVRKKYREALRKDVSRALAAIRQQGPVQNARRCLACGELRPAETFSALRRDRLPLTAGGVNFYPGLAFGVELCGLCTVALRFLPLSLLRAGEGRWLWFLHCQELNISGRIARKYGWDHFHRAISAGRAIDFYGDWRTVGIEGAVARLLFQLLRDFGQELRAIYWQGGPAVAYVFSNDPRGGFVDAIQIPAAIFDFLQRLELESSSAFDRFERELFELTMTSAQREASRFIREVAKAFLSGEQLLSRCLYKDGQWLRGGWMGHRLYLLEVIEMPPATLAVLERLGIDIAEHPEAKKWIGRLERAEPHEVRAILVNLVRAQLLTGRELAAIIPPNEPSAAGLARDVILAVAWEWQRSQKGGQGFPQRLTSSLNWTSDEVIARLEGLANQLRRGLQNRTAWLADLSSARTVAQIRRTYLRAVRQGALSANDFVFLVPLDERRRVWQLRDYLLAFLFEQARDELPPDLEVVEGEEAAVPQVAIGETE